jgi:hypothetical protein
MLHPEHDVRASRDLWRAHAREHGWGWSFEEPDWVALEQGPRCPADLLDRIERAGAGSVSGGQAEVLARNGRFDAVFALLRDDPKAYDQAALRVVARAGQWQRVLELSDGWSPNTHCGTCYVHQEERIRAWRARCWAELGDCELVRDAALQSFHGRRVDFPRDVDPELAELWIGCLVREGQVRDASEALDVVLDELPEAAWPTCKEAQRRWELTHMPESEVGQHLSELVAAVPQRAIPFVRTLDTPRIVELLPAFDRDGESLRDPSLAWALAASGHPAVGPVFDQPEIAASFELSGAEVLRDPSANEWRQLRIAWKSANETWRCLTSGH